MDRKGPLGGRESIEADFSSFSARCQSALFGLGVGLVAQGSFNMLVSPSKMMYVEDPDKLLLLDKIVVAAGETSLASAMSGISFTVEDTYDSFDILVPAGITSANWDDFNGNGQLTPYMFGVIRPRGFTGSRYYDGRLIIGSILWTNSAQAGDSATARYFVFGTLLDRSLFLDSI